MPAPLARRRRFLLLVPLALSLLAACGDDGGASAPEVSGTVVGAGAPPSGELMTVWVVLEPEQAVKLGDGTYDGSSFELDLPDSLPTSARTVVDGLDLGIGIVALMPAGTQIADEALVDSAQVDAALGLSTRHAIIYRGPADTGATIPWTADFPVGFSCGVCVDNPDGFDSYAPVDCSELELSTELPGDPCNFT